MIENFNSVQEYLRAVLRERKSLSIRSLSKKLGYASDRTVGMVVQGRREMGAEMQRRLADFVKLTPKQREYLNLLSEKQKKARLGVETKAVDRLLSEMKARAGKSRRVEPAELAGLTSWFAYSIIEILGLEGRPMTAMEIRSRLRGSPTLAEVEHTLQTLSRLKFIGTAEDGFFRALAQNEFVETPPDIPSVTARAIHRAQLVRAGETLCEQSVDEREFIAKTLSISAERIPALKVRIREMMEELAGQFEAAQAEDAVVAQFNFQFYQQSTKK